MKEFNEWTFRSNEKSEKRVSEQVFCTLQQESMLVLLSSGVFYMRHTI